MFCQQLKVPCRTNVDANLSISEDKRSAIDRIGTWLSQEGIQGTASPQENYDFYAEVFDNARQFYFRVAFLTAKADNLSIITYYNLSTQEQQIFQNMPEHLRQNLYDSIGQSMLYFDTLPSYFPDANSLQVIYLESLIYLDGLTKDRFLRTVREIWRSFLVVRNVCQRTFV